MTYPTCKICQWNEARIIFVTGKENLFICSECFLSLATQYYDWDSKEVKRYLKSRMEGK